MSVRREDFYTSNNRDLSRGDIFRDIPFVRLAEQISLSDSMVVPAREYFGTGEYCGIENIAAHGGAGDLPLEFETVEVVAMCITPTCDIVESPTLSFIPLEPIPEEISADPLLKGIYDNPVGIFDPTDTNALGDCFIDFSKIFPVERILLGDLNAKRLKCLSVEGHDFITTKLARYFGKSWGFALDEAVEDDGIYGCVTCRRYFGIHYPEAELTRGQFPPVCENCKKQKKSASWRLLEKPKSSVRKIPH